MRLSRGGRSGYRYSSAKSGNVSANLRKSAAKTKARASRRPGRAAPTPAGRGLGPRPRRRGQWEPRASPRPPLLRGHPARSGARCLRRGAAHQRGWLRAGRGAQAALGQRVRWAQQGTGEWAPAPAGSREPRWRLLGSLRSVHAACKPVTDGRIPGERGRLWGWRARAHTAKPRRPQLTFGHNFTARPNKTRHDLC